MPWAFSETFEAYPVGATPYPPAVETPGVVQDTLVHTGNRALGPNPATATGSASSVALTGSEFETLPLRLGGWVWCETRTPAVGDESFTPDLLFFGNDGALGTEFSQLTFGDVPDLPEYPQGYFTHHSGALFGVANLTHSPDPYPGPGWYRFDTTLTVDGAVVTSSIEVRGPTGDTLWTDVHTFEMTPPLTVAVILDVPTGTAWDDLTSGVRAVVRKWPRQDALGHSTAARPYGAIPSNRIVGGHP